MGERARVLGLAGLVICGVVFLGSSARAQIPGLPPLFPPAPAPPPPEPQPPATVPPEDSPGRLSLSPAKRTVDLLEPLKLRGRLSGRTEDGKPVSDGALLRLYEDEYPYGRFRYRTFTYTDEGRFGFQVGPQANTRYRVKLVYAPLRSPVATVYTRPKIGVEVPELFSPGLLRIIYRAEGGPGIRRPRARRAYFYLRDPLVRRYRRVATAPLRRADPGIFLARLSYPFDALVRRATRVLACTKVSPLPGMGKPRRYRACGRPLL